MERGNRSRLRTYSKDTDPRKQLLRSDFQEKIVEQLALHKDDPEKAISLYIQSKQIFSVPDVRLCSQVLNIVGMRAGRIHDAFLLWEDMKKLKVKPNAVIYSILVSICKLERDMEKTDRLYQEISEAFASPLASDPNKNSNTRTKESTASVSSLPDLLTMNNLMNIYASAGSAKTFEIFELLKKNFTPDTSSYTILLKVRGEEAIVELLQPSNPAKNF